MNKKSIIAYTVLIWVLRLIYLVVIAITVNLLLGSHISYKVDTFNAESEMFAHRLMTMRGGVSYYDEELGRIYPGIVNEMPFAYNYSTEFENMDIMDGLSSNTHIAAEISLKQIYADYDYPYKVYYNKKLYDDLELYAELGYTKGPGGAKAAFHDMYVLIRDEYGGLQPGLLTINIIIPTT